MTIDFGYGVDLSRTNFKADAPKYIIEHLAPSSILKQFKEYCAENSEDLNEVEATLCFADEYESDIHYIRGIEALLVDCINLSECDGNDTFLYEDYCIYVGARIPVDEKHKASLLTTQDIQRILAKYLNPLLIDTVCVEFLEIRE